MADAPSGKPPRRPRYRGSNPRAFDQKYKELNAARYPGEVVKVLASGKTPAGMHRAIMVREILEVLAPARGEFAVDATLGYGGHTAALLERLLPGGRVLALDVDPIELPKTEARMRAAGIGTDSLIVRRSNFAGLARVLAAEQLPAADVVLADLGLSSMQLDDPARGFTFKREGPLDLRMNPLRGQPASKLLASLDLQRLAGLLESNADLEDAPSMAAAILDRQARTPITTTTALAAAITDAATVRNQAPETIDSTVRRVFQALRVAVNDEYGALDAFLRELPGCLAPRGRVAILTFHSGEDRRVKQAFKEGVRSGAFARIADELMRPTADERRANPRSSAAKLRWAIRT
ncbi:MAG: rRNA (cytosine1402-N4)-methyltransferase [Acidobacteriota bacterium]|jgi:16S rRNA (cytosine1402-N4)-methyltransferase